MTSLHAYFHNRDQAAFQRQLAAPHQIDVNARDWLGRTVLHLACASSARAAAEYVRMLLGHTGINVNLQDSESHWTALHRALYNGNIDAAILLLQKSDIDTDLKDFEGYRAFDVYNTTVEDTMPNKRVAPGGLELFTWGVNRNASLGHGDTDDRTHPEQVVLSHHNDVGKELQAHDKISSKLQPALVYHHWANSRLTKHELLRSMKSAVILTHLSTVVLTDEPHANIRVCGFASGGRLGPGGGQHTQPSLLPVIKLPLVTENMFTAIALGQDHTLALTSDGTVFSWGLGRFSQLGYEVPSPYIQSLPRGIAGPLRRERVRGIAACKNASACWTDTHLYTWGKNNGQLGYDKNATPVQNIPRIVSKISKTVISVVLNDTAMVCLLATRDVVLLSNDAHSRIVFPSPTHLSSDFLAYRPTHAARAITTARIICNENMFATVSSVGEIFTFNAPTPPLPGERPSPIQPQRVWALRKQWSAVHDVALGGDGSLVICTQSGHAFVRSRTGAKAPRFVRVPGLQRVVAVRANDTGALAALREPYRPPDIVVAGNCFAEDMARMRPYFCFTRPEHVGIRVEPTLERPANRATRQIPSLNVGEDEDEGDGRFEAEVLPRDAQEVFRLWDLLAQDQISRRRSDATGQGLFAKGTLPNGADLMLRIQGPTELPTHKVILSARCAVFARVLDGLGSLHDRESGISIKLLPAPARRSDAGAGPPRAANEAPRLAITGVHAFPVLVLLHYLYTDVLLAIGDLRLVRLTADAFAHGRLQPSQAVRDLQTLSRVLDLDPLADILRGAMVMVMRAPSPLLNAHFRAIFDAPMSVSSPDVALQLVDREVWTHSFVLRARSPFFESFFSDEEWTRDRWEGDDRLRVDLGHLEWRSMEYVLRFMCCGEEAEMFERLDFIDSADQMLSLLFDVMFAANELLLDRLLLICSSIVIKYVTINNISAIYVEAAFLHCPPLMDSLHQYISVNMETLLEARLLDDLSPWLVRQIASAVQVHQATKSPFSRLQLPIDLAASENRHREWLAAQDIPYPILRSQLSKAQQPKHSSKNNRKTKPSQPASSVRGGKPTVTVSRTPGPLPASGDDDLFCMDEALVPPMNLDAGTSTDELASTIKAGPGPWKAKSMPRVDMKLILAEEEGVQASGRTHQLSMNPSTTPVHRQRSTSGDVMRVAFSLPNKTQREAASSPGKSHAVPSPTSTSTLAWRSPSRSGGPSSSGLSPGRAATGQMLSRTPPGSTQVSADVTRVSLSLPKTPGAPPPSSTPAISRAASTSASDQWRDPSFAAEPPSPIPSTERTMTAGQLTRTPPPPGGRRAQENVSVSPAPPLRKSWSAQSAPVPGPSPPTLVAPTTQRPSLGPVISPSRTKAGLTATRHASYVHTLSTGHRQTRASPSGAILTTPTPHNHSGNAWAMPPPVEPPTRTVVSQPSPRAPISFAEIQQLQSRSHDVAKGERRSLRDIQAEEAELQAEADFLKWWTAEEERVRVENEAIAASLLQQPQGRQQQHQQQQQHRRDPKGKKPATATTAGGESTPGPKAPHRGKRKC